MGDGQGSIASLLARGPQDSYMMNEGKPPTLVRGSDFSIDQKTYTFGSAPWLGTRQVFSIGPKQIQGDLLVGVYLKLQLPVGPNYMSQLGRGITKQVSLYMNEVEVETLYDDWYFINDQLHTTIDQQTLLQNVLNGTSLYIPLDFSFSLKNPFPLCAAWNQIMYINIDLAGPTEISDSVIELLGSPQIVLETVMLSDQERSTWTTHQMKINKSYREPVQYIKNQLTNVNLTPSFNVKLMTWFLRKPEEYYLKRFDFTYERTTNIALRNEDIFEYIYLFVNNQIITSRFPGRLFYKYLQPLIAGVNTPVSDIYMYSFGDGLDFSKANSMTTTMNIKFRTDFIRDIILNYTLNIYYFGELGLNFSGGFCQVSGL